MPIIKFMRFVIGIETTEFRYDLGQGFVLNDFSQNIANTNPESADETAVIQNPYYNCEEALNPAGSTVQVSENPYYNQIGNNDINDRVTTVENPYYGEFEDNETNKAVVTVKNPYYDKVSNE